MPLNLNSDKLIVVCKQDQYPVVVTGFTPTVITGSGGTTVTNPSYQNFVIYTPNTVLPTVLIGSGDTACVNISGNTWLIYSNTGATGSYVPLSAFTEYTGTTAPNSFLPITGLTGYWDSGDTESYVQSQISGFTTGYTFTASGGTVISESGGNVTIYSPTGGTSGDYVPVSGVSGNLAGVIQNDIGHQMRLEMFDTGANKGGSIVMDTTYLYLSDAGGGNLNQIRLGTLVTDITKRIDIATGLTGTYTDKTLINRAYADLRYASSGHSHDYVSNTTFAAYTGATEITLTGLTVDIGYISGVTDNINSDLTGLTSSFNSHTGDTTIHTTMTQVNAAISAATSGFTGTYVPITGSSGTQDSVVSNIGHEFRVELTDSGVAKGGFFLLNGTYAYLDCVGGGNVNQIRLLPTVTDITKRIDIATGLTGTYGNQTLINRAYADLRYFPYSGYTFTQSGITQISQIGNNVVIFVPPDSITGVTWAMVTSKPAWLSGATLNDFQLAHSHSQYLTGYTIQCSAVTACTNGLYLPINALDGYWDSGQTTAWVNLQGYLTGVTCSQITGCTDTLYLHTDALDGYWDSGDTVAYVTGLGYLTGVTWGQVTGKPDLTLQSDFTGHTSDLSIHYHQSAITITESQVTNLIADLAGKSGTGHTHPQYLTGVTCAMISACTTGFTTTSDFNTYTGTTVPANYYNKTEVDGLISGFTTGYTFTESGATEITVNGNEVIIYTNPTGTTTTLVASGACEVNNVSGNTWVIYAPSGGTGGGTWGTITGSLSAQTDLQTVLDTKASTLATIATKTGTTYTIAAADANKMLYFSNTGATTVTFPSGTTIPTGFQCIIVNYGGQLLTVAAGGGATLYTRNSLVKMRTKYGATTCIYEGTNKWILFGDLST